MKISLHLINKNLKKKIARYEDSELFHFQSLIQHISEIFNSVCIVIITQEQNNLLKKKII